MKSDTILQSVKARLGLVLYAYLYMAKPARHKGMVRTQYDIQRTQRDMKCLENIKSTHNPM